MPLHYRVDAPVDPYSYLPLAAPAQPIETSAVAAPAVRKLPKVHHKPKSRMAAADHPQFSQAAATTVSETVPLSYKEDRPAGTRASQSSDFPRPMPSAIGEVRPGTKLAVTDPQARQTMDEARKLFRSGDVTKARVRFNMAVSAPLGLVLLELGRTFDPNYLSRLPKADAEANIAQARTLYEQASKLGATEAKQEMQRLPAE